MNKRIEGRATFNHHRPMPERAVFRLEPLARAVAWAFIIGGTIPSVQAAPVFSPGWFADKGALQGSVAATGMLPNGKPASSLTSPLAQQQQANAQLQKSIGNLNLAAQAIAAQQAAQAAARQAAMKDASAPDGLAEGGLKVDTNSLTAGWINAKAPVQTQSGGKIQVAIEQTDDKAILNWETFNVGRNTTVQFQQQSDWAVLNRVNDPQARPSQIQGQIKADGTVLIVNRNGIVFSGSSQVNVRNLAAAAATITDTQFAGNGLYGANETASFTDANGKLEIQAGAQIATVEPTSVTQGGGYVLLLGSEVSNAGEITTRKGQAQLVAGDSFVIRKGVGTDSNTASTTRGNEVAPQFNTDSTAGKVGNSGLILSREGDITLAGRDVRQDGVAIATSTVNTRGTIHLLNSASDTLGLVTLGADATTAVVLEDDGTTTALDSQRDALIADSAAQDLLRASTASHVFDNLALLSDRRDQSRIEIVSGGDVRFEGDSLTLATGGQIVVAATNATQVADRAVLDVSGAVGVNLAMTSNNVQVNIQGNELRDSPLNRDSGNLFNNDVWIDRRNLTYVPAGTDGYASDRWYTPGGLLEVSGYLGNQGHRIGEWAAQGGTIVLGGNEVVTQAGSQINLSGGTLNVQTGYIHQTWLKGSDGKLYTLDNAPADMVFEGVYKGFEDAHPRWGKEASAFFYNGLIAPQQRLENGYTVGRDAGRLIVSAPNALMQGDVVADAFHGPAQINARPAGAIDGYKLGQNQAALQGTIAVQTTDLASCAVLPVSTDVVFSNDAPPDGPLQGIWFNADALNSFHLGGLSVLISGALQVDDALALAPGGAFNLLAGTADINADLTARGGSVLIGSGRQTANTDIKVGQGVTIDTRGLWTNALLDPNDLNGLAYVNGGDVTLQSNGGLTLGNGSLIDASAGGAVLANGKLVGGAGGDIALIAGYALNGLASGGNLSLYGHVRSLGFTRGGALTLQSSGQIIIGDKSFPEDGILAANTIADQDLTLAQDLTITAGTPLPLAYTYFTYVTAAPGEVLSEDYGYNNDIVFNASWIMPDDGFGNPKYYVYDYSTGNQVMPNEKIRAGSQYYTEIFIPRGDTLPANVFPDGVILSSTAHELAAGSTFTSDITYTAGTTLSAGSSFTQNVLVQGPSGTTELAADFFSQGFSKYSINGVAGLTVAEGAHIDVTMPVLQFTAQNLHEPTGTDPVLAASLVLNPLYVEDPVHATLTQRLGADLSLLSGVNADIQDGAVGGAVTIAAGSTITVDAGRSVRIASGGQITVDGEIAAPGGVIDIVNNRFLQVTDPGALSVWIGEHAVLDVSAQAYTALDANGRVYGVVPNGGAIILGSDGGTYADHHTQKSTDAMVIVRPGAVLDASGTRAVIDLSASTSNMLGGSSSRGAQTIASDGGSITLSSYDGLYLDGAFRAVAGGSGAAGGTLSIILEAPVYLGVQTVPENLQAGRVLTIGQDYVSSGLDPDLQPGVLDPALVVGAARISAQQIEEGGFDDVSLWGRHAIAFDGDVALHAGRSISLLKGPLYNTAAGGNVTLDAPYLFFGGQTSIVPPAGFAYVPSAIPVFPVGGDFLAKASVIDVQNDVRVNFDATHLESQGDVRFLASEDTPSSGLATTILAASGNLDLIAAQLYPASSAFVQVAAGVSAYQSGSPVLAPGFDLSIHSTTGTAPGVLPYSVFGRISFLADTVLQGGTIRAPLGSISLGQNQAVTGQSTAKVEFLPGSTTSVSAAGLVMPYGGTVDGVEYTVDGKAPLAPNLFNGNFTASESDGRQGIRVNAVDVVNDAGAYLDLSGGGVLTGAAFVSGRGGSVDTLLNPLTPGGKVYAIVPGAATMATAGSGAVAWTGDVPHVGEQITIPAGVPGLPAGTYALLPANYALLPGAYRVELGTHTDKPVAGAFSLPNGSYLVGGVQGTANTAIRDNLPTVVTVTPASTVRTYSQYNEQGYDDFQRAQSSTFGKIRPLLEADGKFLTINLSPPDSGSAAAPALVFNGTSNFAAASGGYQGTLALLSTGDIAITGPDSATPRSATVVPVPAATLNAIGAPNVYIGALPTVFENDPDALVFQGSGSIVLERGAILTGSQIILAGSQFGGIITMETGAEINTLGHGVSAPDSSTGYMFGPTSPGFGVPAIVIVSNGQISLNAPSGVSPSAITIEDGAALYSEGIVAFYADKGVTFGGTPQVGARNIAFALPVINVGDADALAAAAAAGTLPGGLDFNQDFFNRLVTGNPLVGAPAVEALTLSARQSINFYGSVDLNTIDPATGQSRLRQLVFNTPAMYGYGGADDVVNLTTDTLVWGGAAIPVVGASVSFVGAPPGAITPNGPGTGLGTFNINARQIVFGYPEQSQPDSQLVADRLVLGFSGVNLNAAERITANSKASLSVYATGPDPSAGYDPDTYAGSGGKLNMTAPLFTGEPGSIMRYKTGGALTLASPSGVAASTSTPSALGAEIDLSANAISVASAIVLPSGKLTMTAANDITLADGARIDLSGQAIPFFDVTKYSWGGDVELESAHGNIVQAAGSSIDLSAVNEDAGTLKLTATDLNAGQVLLNGKLLGGGGEGHSGGSIDIRAQRIGGDAATLSGDFAALNLALNAGGFFGSRSFEIKQGSLAVGNEVRAHQVAISIDNGGLTVNGTVDASGTTPGAILLAAHDDLTLASDALLDVHGTTLQIDSYGQAIEAKNRGSIELTSSNGWINLNPGTKLDLSSPDSVARGRVDLNAGRTGGAAHDDDTVGDVRVSAAGPLNIAGAASIAVNGFWKYVPTGADGVIVQDNGGANPLGADGQIGLNQIDRRSVAFIDAALANTDLQGRLSGLSAYGAAFHLRPGVEIDSPPSGNLTIAGDLDLSGMRYGPNADRDPASAAYGAGEPGVLLIRASNNLTINGSINDGFAPPPGTPDDNGFLVLAAGTLKADKKLSESITLAVGTRFAPGSILSGSLFVQGKEQLLAGDAATSDIVLHPPFLPEYGAAYYFFGGFNANTGEVDPILVVSGQVEDPYFGVTYNAGDYIPGLLGDGATIHAGTVLTATKPSDATVVSHEGVSVMANKGVPQSVTLAVSYTLAANFVAAGTIVTPGRTYTAGMTIPAGTVLPSGTTLAQGAALPFDFAIASTTWNAGNPLDFVGGYTLTQPEFMAAGQIVPAGTLVAANVSSATPGKIWAIAPMLAAGSQSSSIRLVGGADLDAADMRSVLASSSLGLGGNLALNDPHLSLSSGTSILSVIRTGTGNLDLLAGGSFSQDSLYGIYTAGTQTELAGGNAGFNPERAAVADGSGTLLGAGNELYEAAINRTAYYPDHGGDLAISAQGSMTSVVQAESTFSFVSNSVSHWLWRQGAEELGQNGAWSINFGTYVPAVSPGQTTVVGFAGFGALGGGNVTVSAGKDAGNLQPNTSNGTGLSKSTALVVAVGSTGRVTSVSTPDGEVTGGTLVETGGGDITVKIGGRLNPGASAGLDDLNGSFTDLRGNVDVDAGAIGGIALLYGTKESQDPRAIDPFTASTFGGGPLGGPVVVAGDAAVTLRTRGDLVLGGVGDAGQRVQRVSYQENFLSDPNSSSAITTWFTLWQPTTSIDLFSAGGNLTPLVTGADSASDNDATPNAAYYTLMVPRFSAVAASGSIYYGSHGFDSVILAPSPVGQLELLAHESIYAAAYNPISDVSGLRFSMSGASSDPDSLPNPFKPAYFVFDPSLTTNTMDRNGGLFAFAPDTVTDNLHAGDTDPIRLYAVDGDIVNGRLGEQSFDGFGRLIARIAAKAVQVRAGRDIVNFGGPIQTDFSNRASWSSLIMNANDTDVSVISAGRDMFYTNILIAGPGTLEVSAGGNLYQGDKASITSMGPIVTGDNRPGANIVMQAGVEAAGPDYAAIADRYLHSANQADASLPLADQSGKVAKAYDVELAAWLKENYGFNGTAQEALAYFEALAPEQQHVFLRQVYYAELREGGREYNNPDSKRFGSYLRGREMIATLFPDMDADGNDIERSGDITMFGGSGVRTEFGGDIQMLAPGGQIVVGVQGEVPPASSGVVTQGKGNIQIFSKQSLLLGLSRVMTTFGGDILAWSEEGDINAGRGSKTTLVYTPPKREYDAYGNVTLSPDVPSTGAGIATLNPIPETAPGDIDLIAPLGTIDVGEAGIRVSGNINLAALQVVNAANIQVKGTATGIPTVAAVNVGALTNASAAAAQATMAAQDVVQRERVAARQALPSIFTVRVLGFGNEPLPPATDSDQGKRPSSRPQSDAYHPLSPVQVLGQMDLNEDQLKRLTETERRNLAK